MAKKRKNKFNPLTDIIMQEYMQGYMQTIAPQYGQEQAADDFLLKKETDSLRYEQELLRRRDSNLVCMAMQLQKYEKELHKGKKSMRDMENRIGSLEERSDKAEKKAKRLSEKVDKLCQRCSKQEGKLKKCRSQVHMQKKILRLMGACFGINNSSDNLSKILSKCSKKLDSGYIQMFPERKSPKIIDAEYREV